MKKREEDPLQKMSQASDGKRGVMLREELTEIHHGPTKLRGKYDLVDSDEEGEVDAEALVSSLDGKQRKRLLKYVPVHLSVVYHSTQTGNLRTDLLRNKRKRKRRKSIRKTRNASKP